MRETKKVVDNPHFFCDSFGEVIELLKKLDASLKDAKKAGKHPYFWMQNSQVVEMWEED